MKNRYMTMLAAALLSGAVCQAGPKVNELGQVGPDPALGSQNGSDGVLQVYSARERVPINVNGETFFANVDFGKNEFLHQSAHTSYSIYTADGRLLQKVRNKTGINDSNPTLVKLSPGMYRIKAEAEDYNDVTTTVMVPICVEAGLTTAVHLDGKWNPPTQATGGDMVRLSNGNYVGWHCSGAEPGKYASVSRN